MLIRILFLLLVFTASGCGGGGSSSGASASDDANDSGTVVGGNPGDTPVFDEAVLDEDVME